METPQTTTEKTESLGDRMKAYEEGTRSYIDHKTPLVMRLDGHCFSKFTRGLKKPYEEWLHKIMVKVTAQLVNDYNAVLGFTQSDEITLVFLPQMLDGAYQPYIFNNQIQKLVSLAASNATNIFTMELLTLIHTKQIVPEDYKPQTFEKLSRPRAYFDARIFNVPSLTECYNNVYWRSTYDCIRNSISMTAQTHFPHKALQNLSTKQLLQKLKDEKQLDWEEMDPEFKYGTFIKKKIVFKPQQLQKVVKTDDVNEEEKQEDENKEGENLVQRRKLYAFTLHLPKHDDKIEDFLFSKYYQDDNEDIKKLIPKGYLLDQDE